MKGIEVQDTISNVETAVGDRPVLDVVIEELNIIRVGLEAEKFDAVTTWNEMEPKLYDSRGKEKGSNSKNGFTCKN